MKRKFKKAIDDRWERFIAPTVVMTREKKGGALTLTIHDRGKPTNYIYHAATRKEAEQFKPDKTITIKREPNEHPAIVETWIL